MAGCEDLIRDLLQRGGHDLQPGGGAVTSTNPALIVATMVASGLQPVARSRLPSAQPTGPNDETMRLSRALATVYGVKLRTVNGGYRLECLCGDPDACWLRSPHDDERYRRYFRLDRTGDETGREPSPFPDGSPAFVLLWKAEPRYVYAQEMLVRLLLPLAARDPEGDALTRELRLIDPRTVVAVGLEGGGETMRFVYELVASDDGDRDAAVTRGRFEFPGGTDVAAAGSHAAARRAFAELARVRAEEQLDLGRPPDEVQRRKRVDLVVVAALAAVHVDNLDEVSAAVRDVVRDTGQRGHVLVVNDNLPPLLPDALVALAERPQRHGRWPSGRVATEADVAVKIGAGTVVHVAGVGPGVARLGGAEHVLSDEGGGFQIALQALRGSVRYLQGLVLRPGAEGDATSDELAAEAGKFVGIDRRHWQVFGRDLTAGGDARLAPEDRAAVLAALGRASTGWAADRAMKRRVSAYAPVVCKLADQGNTAARAVVRDAAKDIAAVLEAVLRARAEAGHTTTTIVVSGQIPTLCRTYGEIVRQRIATVAGTLKHPSEVYVIAETTVCALSTAKWLHERMRRGYAVDPAVLLESRLLAVDNVPIRGRPGL